MGIWPWYSELSRVMQGVVAGAGLVVIGLLLRRIVSLRGPRRSTVHVLSKTADPTRDHRGVSIGPPTIDRSEATVGAPLPDVAALRFEDDRLDDEGEQFDREMIELELDPARPQPESPDWARGRALCACCGYPGGYFPWTGTRCALCDWDDPTPVSPEWGSREANGGKLSRWRAPNYDAHGSALSPEDRAGWAGEPTAEQTELRREARTLFDYLRSGDRPDSSEVLERADAIVAQLRELEDRPRWTDE